MKRLTYIQVTIMYLVLALITSDCSDDSTRPKPTDEPKHLWSKHFGDASPQYGHSVACDGSGNVVVTGYFNGRVDFGGGSLGSAGNNDIFLAQFDADGNHLWSKRFGDSSPQSCNSVACNESGNIVIAGQFNGTVDFGGGPLTSAGGGENFLAKFDVNGNHLWSTRFAGDRQLDNPNVAFSGSGNVMVTGSFEGTVDFGGGPLTSVGNMDIFLVQYDANGNHIWSRRFGEAQSQYGYDVACDVPGNVVAAGSFEGTVDFGGGPLTCEGHSDIYLVKFDSNGNHVWSKRFGDGSFQQCHSVVCDGSGDILIMGVFGGTVDFGGDTLTCAGSLDIFLAKFDTDGGHLWSKRFGDSWVQYSRSVACDGSGNVVVTGYFRSTINFGGGTLTSAGADDIFLAEFDSNGNHLWSKRFGDAYFQQCHSTACDGSGNVMVTGYFEGTVDFGGGPLTSAGNKDIFLVKFEP
ncbi:MAG: hypothetical protein JSV33_09645 [bacterium]|nr:MAG: hypothetical protein JSV33_09645 [bacterium]